MKKIGYDLTFVSEMEGRTGEEVFALGLLQGLYDIGKSDNLVVFSDSRIKKQIEKVYPGLYIVDIKKTGKNFYGNRLKKHIKKEQIDIMYYPHVHKYMNTNLACRIMATVHGMNSKDVSKSDRRKTFAKLRGLDKIAAAGKIVKDEIFSRHRHMSRERVEVICNPLTDIRQGVEIVLKKKFLLSVNSDSEQKNLIAILKAFRKIQNEISHDLVVIGTIDEKGRAYRFIKRTGLKDRLIVTGVINRDILFGYYRNADLFINASRYKGFGYTPLEAMASETRVLSVRMPALTDPKGIECDAYIENPHNYSEIADKMLAILGEEKNPSYLKERAARLMRVYGIEGAAMKYAQFFGLDEEV